MGHLNTTGLDVLIAGAGPSGLAMAAEAARFGLRYRIVDKAPHGATRSQALVLHARTLEQFERYELAQSAIETGRRLHRIRIYSDGKRILESSFSELPGNYPFVLFLPQTETERLLTEHVQAQGGEIEREVELESFVDGVDGVDCVLLHRRDGKREELTASYLVGCDGANSTVRRLLGMPFEGEALEFDFFLGDLRVEGDVPGDELSVYLQHGNLVFIGRMDDSHCRIIVTLQEHPRREPTLEDFQNAMDLCGIENLRVGDPRWMALFHVMEGRSPAYSSGRIFLAGDATNVHSPIGSQGMNTGIQDAANLIWKIALVQRMSAPASLLDSYDVERKPHGDTLAQATSVAMRAATASNWFLERMRDAVLARIASLDIVRDRLRDTLADLGVSYHGSPIVRDRGGASALRAGDRVPDCEVVDETQTRFRMFDLLKEPMHTALAVMPVSDTELADFAALLARYRKVLQGNVIVDGDEVFQQKYGDPGGIVYVIRPDGYIGFRSPAGAVEALTRWCEETFSAP